MASRVPETQYHREEREKDGWSVVGIAARDGQLGREAKAGSNHRDEEWRQDVADVACLAQVPRSSRERCLASPGENDALRDGVRDTLRSALDVVRTLSSRRVSLPGKAPRK